MAVQVRHSLAGIRTIVEDQAVTRLSQSQLIRHLGGFEQEMPDYLLIFRCGLGHARDGFPGDNQDVRCGLRLDVAECHHQVVLIDNRGWNFAGNDLLEQRLAHSGQLWISPSYSTTKANSRGAASALRHWRR